jgi:hypothetical protein
MVAMLRHWRHWSQRQANLMRSMAEAPAIYDRCLARRWGWWHAVTHALATPTAGHASASKPDVLIAVAFICSGLDAWDGFA